MTVEDIMGAVKSSLEVTLIEVPQEEIDEFEEELLLRLNRLMRK